MYYFHQNYIFSNFHIFLLVFQHIFSIFPAKNLFPKVNFSLIKVIFCHFSSNLNFQHFLLICIFSDFPTDFSTFSISIFLCQQNYFSNLSFLIPGTPCPNIYTCQNYNLQNCFKLILKHLMSFQKFKIQWFLSGSHLSHSTCKFSEAVDSMSRDLESRRCVLLSVIS